MGYGDIASLYGIAVNGKVKLYREVKFNELHSSQNTVHVSHGQVD
jgi:hypothetical protein